MNTEMKYRNEMKQIINKLINDTGINQSIKNLKDK